MPNGIAPRGRRGLVALAIAGVLWGGAAGAAAPMPDVIAHIPCLDHDGISNGAPENPYVLTTETYRGHITWLYNNGYTPMTFRDFMQRLSQPGFPDAAR